MKKILLLVLSAGFYLTNAQYEIKPVKGYTDDVGNLVAMLEDLKGRLTGIVSNLDQEETDFLLDDKANRIGAMILHLAATEVYYQKYTFESRQFNEDEGDKWELPLTLGDKAREEFQGKPISYYLAIWDEVRKETLEVLKTKDDKWLSQRARGGSMNNYWAWFHVMEHQANHIGQIRLIQGRMDD